MTEKQGARKKRTRQDKASGKKASGKKVPPKKVPPKKAASKKAASKKAASKKAASKKAASKRASGKKAPKKAARVTAKKPGAKKVPNRKSAPKPAPKSGGGKMATYKKPAGALRFNFDKPAYLALRFERDPSWLFNGRFGSKTKALAALDVIRERGANRENYDITYQKSGDHYYFTLRGPKNENLGGKGGFSSEQAAREAIAYLAAYVPMVPFEG